jgi:hypothetical protein
MSLDIRRYIAETVGDDATRIEGGA